jgi:hypothetical protein
MRIPPYYTNQLEWLRRLSEEFNRLDSAIQQYQTLMDGLSLRVDALERRTITGGVYYPSTSSSTAGVVTFDTALYGPPAVQNGYMAMSSGIHLCSLKLSAYFTQTGLWNIEWRVNGNTMSKAATIAVIPGINTMDSSFMFKLAEGDIVQVYSDKGWGNAAVGNNLSCNLFM